MDTNRYPQLVKPTPTISKEDKWVAEAAARAEERSRGSSAAYLTPLGAVQELIAAIMDPGVTRSKLRAIAKSMSGGGA